jgi:polyhydroxybutyrate depolymerase
MKVAGMGGGDGACSSPAHRGSRLSPLTPATLRPPLLRRRALRRRRAATFAVTGWPDRDYDLSLPAFLSLAARLVPVLIVLHGGAGNKDNMRRLACPGGDLASAGCLDRSPSPLGMAVVFPNGSNSPAARLLSRGGRPHLERRRRPRRRDCVSGDACSAGVDDVATFGPCSPMSAAGSAIDPKRVFATGFSNGAALAHRLAVRAADVFAAVAPVSGENQRRSRPCAPSRPVAVLAIHGTLDRCWPLRGGAGACIATGRYVSVRGTLAGWAARNGCRAEAPPETLPPRPRRRRRHAVVRHSLPAVPPRARCSISRSSATATSGPTATPTPAPPCSGGTLSRQLDTGQGDRRLPERACAALGRPRHESFATATGPSPKLANLGR